MDFNNKICRLCNGYMQLHEMKKIRMCSCGNRVMEVYVITLEQYAAGREKQYPKEWTPEVVNNAKLLLEKVNMFLGKLGVTNAIVASGWRSAAINAGIANAAPKSNHMTGLAIDIQDIDGKLKDLVLKHLDEAQRLGLYFEDFRHTGSWVHLQVIAPKSHKRIFIPSSSPAPHPERWNGSYEAKFDS